MAKKQKYYVIWEGKVPGIYTSWEECQVQIAGFPSPKFKSFDSRVEAEFAFARNYTQFIKKSSPEDKPKVKPSASTILSDSICVDAACSGNPGDMEYQCVETNTKILIFHQGPFKDGTNNVGEFLALVHALALLHKNNNTHTAIYTDSKTAMSWVKNKKAKTTLGLTKKNAVIHDLISRAESWLRGNNYQNKIIKWETEVWGEIPADFGRK
ncbi:MAG TPA: ribonuclease H family protein [Saprospiraceae bacterium]|nr:ribonuclease H family protein [Saprospiraceae bacterium]